jgi:hypothetical protein
MRRKLFTIKKSLFVFATICLARVDLLIFLLDVDFTVMTQRSRWCWISNWNAVVVVSSCRKFFESQLGSKFQYRDSRLDTFTWRYMNRNRFELFQIFRQAKIFISCNQLEQ